MHKMTDLKKIRMLALNIEQNSSKGKEIVEKMQN